MAIYVAHPCANQVLKLDPASPTLAVTQTAATTSRPGRIASPRYLTGPANTRAVYVALPDAKAVASFAPTDLGAGPDALRTYDYTPSDLFIDEFGVLFVGDLDYDIVRFYGSDGSQFRYRGGTGSGVGQLNDAQAFDVAGQDGTDKAGNIFVADSGNSRVQRWDSYSYTYWTADATGTGGGPVVPAPTNTAAPTISGTAVVGTPLDCRPGTWGGSPTFTYQWRRDGSDISGATGATYTLVAADAGRAITCRVTGTNSAGSAQAVSQTVTPTASTTALPVIETQPRVTGDANPGAVLTCGDGTWRNSPTSYSKRWVREGVQVGTGDTYAVGAADVGRLLICKVTATNAAGSAEADGPRTQPSWRAPVNTGAPQVQGSPAVGQAVTCTQGSWAWAPQDYAYSWRRDGAEVATGAQYTLVAADAGRSITCVVTASNPAGSASSASAAVSPPAPPTPATRVGVTINDGAEATNTAAVTLRIREPAGATAVVLSNDGSFDSPTQVPVAANDTYSWTLDARGSQKRARVVYVRFVGGAIDGNQTFQDDILLDTSAPTVTTATINARSTATSATARVAATDSGSGVQRIQYSGTKSAKKAKTLKLKKSRSFKVKPRNAKWVRAVDVAGNTSKWKRIAYRAPKRAKR